MDHFYRRFQEIERPLYHFTPESKWLNDPNGLLYFKGEYHLFHQHNWFGKVHWGHAVSRDLVHWEHKPPALFPRQEGSDWLQPWSGTAVVDWNNTSGLQQGDDPVFLAYFTYSRQPGDQQSQSMAYSNDRGSTWKEFERNPVVPNPGIRDFRDPKVFWHGETERWIMAVVAGDHVKFYSSLNGLDWSWLSEFGKTSGSHGGVWECPDLFPMKVDGEETEKWVLIISVGNGSPGGGTGMQYFVGHFDGKEFTADSSPENVRWVDYGQDFYAAISWNEVKDGRRVWVGWMSNWCYANSLPTEPYQGQLSIVRELCLRRDDSGQLYLSQGPVEEQKALRKAAFLWENVAEPRQFEEMMEDVRCECMEVEAEVTWEEETPPEAIELRVRMKDGHYTSVGFTPDRNAFYLDRSQSGKIPHPLFNGRHEVKREESSNLINLRIFVDRQSIEVLADQGKYVLSDLIFPESGSDQLEWKVVGGEARIVSCRIYPLRSAWPSEEEKPLWAGHALSGQWAVTSQGVEGASAETGVWLLPETLHDFEMSAEIEASAFGSGGASGFGVRLNSSGTKGYLAAYDADTKTVGLYRLTAVAHELIHRVPWEMPDSGRAYLTVKAQGHNIEVSINGSVIIQVHDHAYFEGYTALYVRRSFTVFNQIDLLSL